jgi:hypothetical protein
VGEVALVAVPEEVYEHMTKVLEAARAVFDGDIPESQWEHRIASLHRAVERADVVIEQTSATMGAK